MLEYDEYWIPCLCGHTSKLATLTATREMAVSMYVSRPEDVSVRVTGYNEWFFCEEAQQYSLDKWHRALWASTMHNTQLRELSQDLGVRCQWWARYYDFVMTACRAIVCHFVHNGDLVQPLLAQLTFMAMQLKPIMADMQLPLPVLIQQHGIIEDKEKAKKLWKVIEDDLFSTWALNIAVGCQNGLLLSAIEQQQFYAKLMRELCSTRRVAGLLQALVGQYRLTHLLPDDVILKSLRTLLAGRRSHGCLGFETVIEAETVIPAHAATAAGASSAGSQSKPPTSGPIAHNMTLSSPPASSAPLLLDGAVTVRSDHQCFKMDREAGEAGAVHGALSLGALATTCSQGLSLMMPDTYETAGELLPCVIHLSARALAEEALSTCGDHQDVMAVRQTDWAMLCSHGVQEAQDGALPSHIAAIEASVPFVHFLDSFRTSQEISEVSVPDQEAIRPLMGNMQDAGDHHRQSALIPLHPHQRSISQGPDIYFHMLESANNYYLAVPEIVQQTMTEVAAVTCRPHKLFEYVGAPDAEHVVIAMGSECAVIEETVDYLTAQGEKVGLLKINLFSWSFLEALPATAKKVAVLDCTKEPGSMAEYLDVAASVAKDAVSGHALRQVAGGHCGFGSKDYTPAMAKALSHRLKADKPKNQSAVGILTDDVTFTSLPIGSEINTLPKGTYQCSIWAMGSDGTVGANKEAIKVVTKPDDTHAQINKVIKVTAAPYLRVPAPLLDLLQAHFKKVDAKSFDFAKVLDLPVLGTNKPAQLTLTDVTVPHPGTVTLWHDSVIAGAQQQDITDICHDNEAESIGTSHEVKPRDGTVPGSATKRTVNNLPGCNKQKQTCSQKPSSWRRMCRFGKTLAATGVVFVASLLLHRHEVRKRL